MVPIRPPGLEKALDRKAWWPHPGHGNRPRAHIERPSEDAGKAERVIDLVDKVAALRPVATTAAPASIASDGHVSGIGLAHGKTIGFGAILATHSRG